MRGPESSRSYGRAAGATGAGQYARHGAQGRGDRGAVAPRSSPGVLGASCTGATRKFARGARAGPPVGSDPCRTLGPTGAIDCGLVLRRTFFCVELGAN